MAEKIYLQAFYDKLSSTIRIYDSGHPICLEPVTWNNTVPVGFSHSPGGNRFKDKSILCYHFYMPPSVNLKTINARVKDA
jgi:endoglycosylceramidase